MLPFHDYPDRASRDCALAVDVAARLAEALRRTGQARLDVSGGRSPAGWLRALSRQPLDWGRVTVGLVDERCVPADHPDSNAALVRRALLQGPAAAAGFRPLYDGHSVGRSLAEAGASFIPADVTVLGMGEDGHTASLFPGAAGLEAALSGQGPAFTVIEPPAAAHRHLTQTLAALRRSGWVVLSLDGADKRAVWQAAQRGCDLPVARVLGAVPAAEVRWAP